MIHENDAEPGLQCVLVTGGTGFVALHVILQLLDAGYLVRTTIRSSSREKEVRNTIRNAGVDARNRLSFFVADLMSDDGWAESMQGCTFVQHVASPFPGTAPKDENELIRPARDGTLRVLRLARDAGVKRVVVTSSFAAIGYGHEPNPLFTEDHWSVLDGKISVPAYHKSKTLAEKAAWHFMQEEGGNLELAVINPTGVFGPVLNPNLSASIQIIKDMLSGDIPEYPQISFGVVDVRDLADLHIRAMTNPAGKNQRFIGTCDNGPVSKIDVATMLRKERPEHAHRLPTFDGMLPDLGSVKKIDNTKAKTTLGWKPRSIEGFMSDTVDSLVEHGAVASQQ